MLPFPVYFVYVILCYIAALLPLTPLFAAFRHSFVTGPSVRSRKRVQKYSLFLN